MNTKISRLAAGFIACAAPAWAVASTELPAYETYSTAADFGRNVFDSSYTTQLLDATSTPGTTTQISGTGYTASASSTLGSNHVYASASAIPSNVLNAGSFSGWYDQVTITGGSGSGTGTAYFTVQLSGTVEVGAIAGRLGYALGTSSVHPSQLVSNTLTFNTSGSYAWPMDSVNPIATYLLGVSPYNDTSILFPSTSTGSLGGIPSIDPSLSLGGDTGMGFPTYDLVLTPGPGQSVNVTLHGTLNFIYGESFYLIGGLGTTLMGDGLESFCSSDSGETCTLEKDGTGATTLDFSNSANLLSITLPEGATASFASGTAYNVTAVPEPGEWLMMLAGLGLVGWRARRKSA